MANINENIDTLQHIKSMMEKSSRFISLSGLSGIAAGVCALLGAGVAHYFINTYYQNYPNNMPALLFNQLILTAICVLVLAFLSAFFFTYLKSKKDNTSIWGSSVQKLLFNTLLPMIVGGFFIIKLIYIKEYELVAPCCLLFYGLALVNGSKFTLGEVRYLGITIIVLGLLNLYFVSNGLLFWTLGFGLAHIIYGVAMWYKYERN